jgi:hypothetical protein
MKRFLSYIGLASLLIAAPAIDWLWHRPHNPPPVITGELWPSCHWQGTQDQNDWIVVFQIDDLKQWKIAWKQQVATGISEQAAEHLCDAYVDLEKSNGK